MTPVVNIPHVSFLLFLVIGSDWGRARVLSVLKTTPILNKRKIIYLWMCAGFTTATRACCGNGGQFAGIIPCGPSSSMCQDRSKHVFWDPYHPSEAANLLLAKQLLEGDKRYISPINLRQLRDL